MEITSLGREYGEGKCGHQLTVLDTELERIFIYQKYLKSFLADLDVFSYNQLAADLICRNQTEA